MYAVLYCICSGVDNNTSASMIVHGSSGDITFGAKQAYSVSDVVLTRLASGWCTSSEANLHPRAS